MVDTTQANFNEGKPFENGRVPSSARELPSHYNDLGAVLDAAWTCLKNGAANRRSGFHTSTIATVRADGLPALRTVVLRAFRSHSREIVFHTDIRSRKAAEIAGQPAISALFYDAQQKIQIRLDCTAKIDVRTATSRESWQKSRAMSRMCYAQAPAPGAVLNGTGSVEVEALPDELAFENFAVVAARITSLDWLYLAAQGHRRARFDWTGDDVTRSWIAP